MIKVNKGMPAVSAQPRRIKFAALLGALLAAPVMQLRFQEHTVATPTGFLLAGRAATAHQVTGGNLLVALLTVPGVALVVALTATPIAKSSFWLRGSTILALGSVLLLAVKTQIWNAVLLCSVTPLANNRMLTATLRAVQDRGIRPKGFEPKRVDVV